MMKSVAKISCRMVALASILSPALAANQGITIESDKTQMISIAVKPGTVVVGNPSIADVSINGNQVFVHGHGYGNTNIIILDTTGNQLANFDVTVKQSVTNAVSVFKGSTRYSMACDPICEYNLQPGDSADWFKAIAEQQGTKNDLASGSETTEAQAPTAPQ
jgi:Pilus formation protein N terminal region